VIGFNRNAWSDSAETGGRIQPKRVIGFTRNPQAGARVPISGDTLAQRAYMSRAVLDELLAQHPRAFRRLDTDLWQLGFHYAVQLPPQTGSPPSGSEVEPAGRRSWIGGSH
jgi:hypothetical protein